jgi:hypothetical protein
MTERRFPWEPLLALIVGIGLGLVYAWIISPVEIYDAAPEALRADFKDQYRAVIAASYAANGNLSRAQSRLALLGDADSYAALSAQAQQALAAGESQKTIQQLAALAAAIQGPAPTVATQVVAQNPSPTLRITTVASSPDTLTPDTPTPFDTETPVPFYTATPRPTSTPIPPPAKPFEIASQESFCDESLLPGLLQVITQFTSKRQIPGIELVISWAGGEEHFFTGLKPELGNGYADFQMTPGVSYFLRAVEGGTPVIGLTPPTCEGSAGTYNGQVLVVLQRP